MKTVFLIVGELALIIPFLLAKGLTDNITSVFKRIGITIPGQKLAESAQKKADGFRDRKKGQRELRALKSGRPNRWKRRAKREAIDAGVQAEIGHAKTSYIAGKAVNSKSFRNQLAGGTALRSASPESLQRALAGAKFTLEKVEAEEVKAHHATIDGMNENALNNVINSKSSSQTQIAAAMERLVQVGSTDSIASAIDKHASSGESNVITKSLAGALAKDGPAFLKASDIDTIGRGMMGKSEEVTQNGVTTTRTNASSVSDIAEKNIAAGVYSQEKMVAASSDELTYASRNANAAGHKELENTASELKKNKNLQGKIKHNKQTIEDLETHHGVI